MQIGTRGISLIQGYENCRLTAYLPTSHDVWTIGWGTTGPEVHEGLTITQETADMWFARDLAKFSTGVAGMLRHPPSQLQFDAMVSLAYNIGLGNFDGSTVRRRHNEGKYAEAEAAFALWNKQKGKVLRGLVRRRADEAKLYHEGTEV
jgi:lysozyme